MCSVEYICKEWISIYKILGISAIVLFVLFIGSKLNWKVVFEKLAVIWFKLAFSVMILFGAHLLLAMQGIVLPINIFSIVTVTFLGVPGILCVGFTTFLLNF
ncbi:pro-sigmaK processing inhibitor BofA family protein [Metasolibacillus meyeri]|uniref:pro-sigmaK processing inhibitor BofA family protein n=1 Tax=Metasolibacillus meyeri TaxID=1071052 RepID=UPI00398BB1D4